MSKAAAASAKGEKKTGFVHETVEIVKTVVYALLIALVIRTLFLQPYTIPSASMEPNLYAGDYIIVSKWSYGYSRHSILFSPPLFKGRILFSPPKRGDIIVFKLPSDPNIDYIKRLIGLPGDTIQEKGGTLYINGKPVRERVLGTGKGSTPFGPGSVTRIQETNPEGRVYVTQDVSKHEAADNTGVYTVPPHCYFMMGDNRDNSADSRFPPAVNSLDDPKLGGCGWDERMNAAVSYDTGVGFVPEDNLEGRAMIVLLSWDAGEREGDPNGASIFKPWTWFTKARPSRFFHLLH